jgi:hypothetical protein
MQEADSLPSKLNIYYIRYVYLIYKPTININKPFHPRAMYKVDVRIHAFWPVIGNRVVFVCMDFGRALTYQNPYLLINKMEKAKINDSIGKI